MKSCSPCFRYVPFPCAYQYTKLLAKQHQEFNFGHVVVRLPSEAFLPVIITPNRQIGWVPLLDFMPHITSRDITVRGER